MVKLTGMFKAPPPRGGLVLQRMFVAQIAISNSFSVYLVY
jgi:hypothetical protein